MGEVTESGGKKKLSNIRAPMEGGKLMCEVDLEDGLVRLDRLASGPEDEEVVRPGHKDSAPDGEVDGAVCSAPVDGAAVRGGRGPNRGRRVSP